MHYLHCLLSFGLLATIVGILWLIINRSRPSVTCMPPPCYVFTHQQLPSALAAATLLNFTIATCFRCCRRHRAAPPSPRQGGTSQMTASWPFNGPWDVRGAHACADFFFLLSALCWYLGCAGLWKKDHLQVDKEDLAPSITLRINRRCHRAAIKALCSMLSLLSGIVQMWMARLGVLGAGL